MCLHVQDDQDEWGSRCQEREEKIGGWGNDMPKWRCEEGSCIMDSGDTRRVETSLGYTPTIIVSFPDTIDISSTVKQGDLWLNAFGTYQMLLG